MNPDNTIATFPPTSMWVCGTGPAQQPQQQQNTAATICTQYGCPPYQPFTQHNCQPGGQHQNTAATVCTQYGCQPQQNVNMSVPPHCPTVAPMCPPPAYGGGQAQAQFPTWPPIQCTTGILTAVVGCAQQGQQAQQAQQGGTQAMPPSIIGCQPTQQVMGCTTIAGYTHNPPMCPPPPANMGGQAQAQFPTWPPLQCATVTITAVLGCAQQGQQAQAQGSYYTMTCLAPQAQGQQQALPHTMFPPVCAVGGGNTGAYTHIFGCTTVTSTPTTPNTHFPGCTGVTATPATVGHTQLMGCTTITSTPHTYSAGCTPTAVGYTHLMGCTTVTSAPMTQAQGQGPAQGPGPGGQTGALPPTYHPAGGCGPVAPAANGGQAQAQIQFPTIPPTVCVATAAFNCGHITGIVFVC